MRARIRLKDFDRYREIVHDGKNASETGNKFCYDMKKPYWQEGVFTLHIPLISFDHPLFLRFCFVVTMISCLQVFDMAPSLEQADEMSCHCTNYAKRRKAPLL